VLEEELGDEELLGEVELELLDPTPPGLVAPPAEYPACTP
jgi:hypothetical protein